MGKRIKIDPVTRIEGHLAINLDIEKKGNTHIVKSAYSLGQMFRGFEIFLKGRDPLDAQQITQRICGVCPISHGIASCKAQEMAYGIRPNKNGRLLQNLILAANYMQSHILHFYLLAALDFIDITAILKYKGKDLELQDLKRWAQSKIKALQLGEPYALGPFLPRYEGEFYIKDPSINVELIKHYLMALDIRRMAHEMASIFGAKLPHATALIPGGCTQVPHKERILSYRSRLKLIKRFVKNVYIPDVKALFSIVPKYWKIGSGYKNMLSYGVFDLDSGDTLFKSGAIIYGQYEPLDIDSISEDVEYSKFSSPSSLHPSKGETVPDPDKQGAYSWLKAPRYKGHPMEAGPLARILIDYKSPGDSITKNSIKNLLNELKIKEEHLYSVAGRHIARAIELKFIIDAAFNWLDELDIDGPPAMDFDMVKHGKGVGLTEAPRGALGHWLSISDYKIEKYQCVVPSTWNFSPRDKKNILGPVEMALKNTFIKNPKQPIEAVRIIRSFDPCLACAIH